MQQEFISSYGKVILENNIVFIRKIKPSLTFSEVVRVMAPVFFLIRFVFYIFEDNTPERNFGLVLFGLLSILHGIEPGYDLYKALFTKSFAKRIPLQKIHGYRVEDDANCLEVHLFLQLRSGRERKITFRKLEEQHEKLISFLPQSKPVSNFAY